MELVTGDNLAMVIPEISSERSQRIAPQILVALVDVITGGSASSSAQPVGIYRSGPEIVRYFMRNGYDDSYGAWSRVAHTEEKLREILSMDRGPERILALVENVVTPVDYVGREDRLQSGVDYLNQYLSFEGLELRWDGRRHRIFDVSRTTPAVAEAQRVVDELDFEACRLEFERAVSNLQDDPAAAITAASSTLESMAKTMLTRLGEALPSDQTVGPLVAAVMRRLGLAPENQDDQDIRRLLGGLANIVQAAGTLRTKYGSAHGRAEPLGPMRDLAELCVNGASAVALFLLHRYAEETRPSAEA